MCQRLARIGSLPYNDVDIIQCISMLCAPPGASQSDWMHDTARCLGYPSGSTRAARERARETTCGRHLRPAGHARLGWVPPSLASRGSTPAPWRDSPPPWLNSAPAAQRFALRSSTLAPVLYMDKLEQEPFSQRVS